MQLIVKDKVLYSSNIAIKDDLGNFITYRELFDEAQRLGTNIEKRSLMVILCDHTFETVKMLYKCLTMNYVPILLGADVDLFFLDNIINVYCPRYIWCDKNHAIADRYPIIFEEGTHNMLEIESGGCGVHEDLALLLSTSGSTGSEKLVRISYENLRDNTKYVCESCGIREGQNGITVLPFNYTYGFCFCLWHWYCGATLLITKRSVVSKEFNIFFSKEHVDNYAAIPYTFQLLNRLGFWDEKKLLDLHIAMSAGAQMSDDLQKKMVLLMDDKFWIVYGQTEITCVIAGTNFERNEIKMGTVGKAFQNVKVWVDENNGEMVVEGRTVSMGYALDGGDLLLGDVNNGLVRTGDQVVIDEDGYIYLKGRLNRYIKILGNRLNLDEIERFLYQQMQNSEFACVGHEDEMVVYYSAEKDMEAEIGIALHKVHVPPKCIKSYRIDRLPRNKAGKLLYSQLNYGFDKGGENGKQDL